MYTQENYLWGLVAYGLGFMLLVPAVYHVLRVIMPWRPGRIFLWLVLGVLLLTPVRAYTDLDYLAPAWIVAGFEFVRVTAPEGPARAVTPMVFVFIAALLALVAGYFAKRHLIDSRRSPASIYTDESSYRHGEGDQDWRDGRDAQATHSEGDSQR